MNVRDAFRNVFYAFVFYACARVSVLINSMGDQESVSYIPRQLTS